MPKIRTTARKTTLSVREGLAGWIAWRGSQNSAGVGGYLMDLAAEERAEVLSRGGEEAERYKMYLRGMAMDDELEKVEALEAVEAGE